MRGGGGCGCRMGGGSDGGGRGMSGGLMGGPVMVSEE